ncbi:MAG: NAD-dependent protein deacylase [Deltaproteobacteria bacterium]|nr:NAD-dependent protein deacylase [Deltaproteobacteria bacterium]
MDKKITQIADKIKQGGKNIVFTGAGISTESGIPDYRSQGGIWDKFRPVYFDEFMSSRESREEYWRRWQELYRGIQQAQPNAGHTAIARLFNLGLMEMVVTQNVDGLHQEAGIADDYIIELHGNTRRIRCMSCRKITSTAETVKRLDSGDMAPECDCGGYFKPDTVSFGQAMPVVEVEKAAGLSQSCDFFMVVGSTLLVQPAAHMPVYARQNNAFLAIINLSETPCDNMCDVLIRHKAGEVLQSIVQEVEKVR